MTATILEGRWWSRENDAREVIRLVHGTQHTVDDVAQGIGTALYEEMLYNKEGQPLAATLADYHLPGAVEMPNIKLEHMETPSPLSRFGQKGLGEGGAIGPPAAIANAINDALASFGIEMLELPITPARVRASLANVKAQA